MHPSLVVLSQEYPAALEHVPSFELHLSLMWAVQSLSMWMSGIANVEINNLR